MNIQVNSVCFTGKWNIFNVFGKQRSKALPLQQADTFIRTTPPLYIDLKNIQKGDYLNAGNDATVYLTNNPDYVLRITRRHKYIPKEMIPVQDGNGLIVATNKQNTVQLLKFIKGEPLYGYDWDVLYSSLTKEQYFEYFNKIKELPDESFIDYMNSIVNIRKCGYDIDSLNPNNVLLDGTKLNIVDIEKHSKVQPTIIISDFYSLVDYFHINEMMSYMNNEEKIQFLKELDTLFDRIISIADKEGYKLDKTSTIKLLQL